MDVSIGEYCFERVTNYAEKRTEVSSVYKIIVLKFLLKFQHKMCIIQLIKNMPTQWLIWLGWGVNPPLWPPDDCLLLTPVYFSQIERCAYVHLSDLGV